MGGRPAVQGMTVDAPGTRDRDDAIWVERTPTDGYLLTVSVTAVALHVERDSPDDVIAASRGLNFYGEGLRSAMFGEHVTTRMASLDPRILRPVIAHQLAYEPGPSGSGLELVHEKTFLADLRSMAAIGYSSFDDILGTPDSRLQPMCQAAVTLARSLWARRVAAVGMPDWNSAFDARGAIRGDILPGEVGKSVVHEFMVAANASATKYLASTGRPVIYRNQGPRPGGPGGRYEIVCHGHGALGVPAYAQFTIPLRNYVSLVNQRGLVAALKGLPVPYTVAEHAAICARGNVSAQRAEALARTRSAQPDQDPASVPLDRLDPFAFRRLVRRRGGFDRRTLRDFQRRLDGGLLTHSDAAWLLFDRNSPSDDSLCGLLLARLAASPGHFDRIWQIAREDHGLPPFAAELVRHGENWSAAASAGRFTGSASHTDPVATRELALLRMVASALGLPALDPAAPGSKGIRFTDTRARRQLEQLADTMGWDPPLFCIAEDPAGLRGRTASGHVEVVTDSFHYRSPMVAASNAAAAEMAAAELAQAALKPYADDVLRRDVRNQGIDLAELAREERTEGAIRAADTFCMRYGARQTWIWTRERPGTREFNCMLEVSAGGNTLRAYGYGSSRTDARNTAAQAAVSMILGRAVAPDTEPGPQADAAAVAELDTAVPVPF